MKHYWNSRLISKGSNFSMKSEKNDSLILRNSIYANRVTSLKVQIYFKYVIFEAEISYFLEFVNWVPTIFFISITMYIF